ncbi:unnamed protein product [Lymnaea stagnalis]|uniref:Uncharacterized protein n=1 Tax=Lymnaea stagnalis TaxID=6523 RepID=A0AAV2IF09_LYMST
MDSITQLRDPNLPPCPQRDDLSELKDDRCRPVHCNRPVDMTGLDCCQQWQGPPNSWSTDVVRVDQFNPGKCNYDQYRYQLYAKPRGHQDYQGSSKPVPNKVYEPPVTDIRALRQTTYIPVIPTKPGGVREVTFPMTPETMGQPDVTTACCIPVIPCNPGFQNLTPYVMPDPRTMCDTYSKCKPPQQMVARRTDICSEMKNRRAPSGTDSSSWPSPQQYMMPPSNQSSDCCTGFRDTFPQVHQHYGTSDSQHTTPLSHQYETPSGYISETESSPRWPNQFTRNSSETNVCHSAHQSEPRQVVIQNGACLDILQDGLNPYGGNDSLITSSKALKFADRVKRSQRTRDETQERRDVRLRTMYGSYGSYLLARVTPRRNLLGPRNNISNQGNGFTWSYPKNDGNLCYILERNPRC